MYFLTGYLCLFADRKIMVCQRSDEYRSSITVPLQLESISARVRLQGKAVSSSRGHWSHTLHLQESRFEERVEVYGERLYFHATFDQLVEHSVKLNE